MKNGGKYSSRRHFLKTLALGLPLLLACRKTQQQFSTRVVGANHSLGHRLREMNFPAPAIETSLSYLIVGGGIAGLSAARRLKQKGISDFLLLELETKMGGNSASSRNQHSAFPLGAHYLPLPDLENKELIEFLQDAGVFVGYDTQGMPLPDEAQLTFSPQERLFIRGTWQEGLIPQYGVSPAAKEEIANFLAQMEDFRKQKGKDGKYFFTIPLCSASEDNSLQYLDKMSMAEWLKSQNFKVEELLYYVDYCCKDDFGQGINTVSAWAGIHYFAARRGILHEKYKENVFTWAEGNGKLVKELTKDVAQYLRAQQLVYSVKVENQKVEVLVWDAQKQQSQRILAEKVILATPQFINARILPERKINLEAFTYTPWLTANLSLNYFPDNLCWDNVLYGAEGLGYISNRHQELGQIRQQEVITYYHAFAGKEVGEMRRALYAKKEEDWKKFVLDALKVAHPEIESWVESIEIQLWGHGMISPMPGFLFGEERAQARQSWQNRIFFAHSDLSGISLFEEAFYQGLQAVDAMLENRDD